MCSCSPDPSPTPPRPNRRRIKRLLLWAARHLNPVGDFHDGPVTVAVLFGPAATVPTTGADSAIVVPDADADGLTAPSTVRPDPDPDDGPPSRSELLATYLSDDSKTVLRELAAREPCQAQAVLAAVAARVGKTNFWSLWKQLQVRGLVSEGPGGFRLAHPWLRSVIGLGFVLLAARGQSGFLLTYYLRWPV